MRLRNTTRIAFAAIRRNKVRSALTALGVVIGVASVIAMVALGSGARAAIDQQIQAQGTNVVFVSAGSVGRGFGAVRGGAGSTTTLTVADEAALAAVPGVLASSPVVRGRAQVIAGNQNWNTSVEGGDEDYLAIRNWTVVAGEAFGLREVASSEKVCLLGATVSSTLFPDQTAAAAVGQVIRIRNIPFRVIGVLGPKGQGTFGQDQDDVIIAPWTAVQRRLLGISFLHQVSLTATSADEVEPLAQRVTALLRERHEVRTPEDEDFSVRTVAELAATRTEMANTMTMLLMSVASVSLLVGGIGIMNIMLVSVTERTREIGLRMALGARSRDVLAQFLAEAIGLSVAGGLAGLLLGVGISRSLTQTLGWPTTVTPGAIAVAFAFSAAVGIFFGYYPAQRAARMDPIEALRHE